MRFVWYWSLLMLRHCTRWHNTTRMVNNTTIYYQLHFHTLSFYGNSVITARSYEYAMKGIGGCRVVIEHIVSDVMFHHVTG